MNTETMYNLYVTLGKYRDKPLEKMSHRDTILTLTNLPLENRLVLCALNDYDLAGDCEAFINVLRYVNKFTESSFNTLHMLLCELGEPECVRDLVWTLAPILGEYENTQQVSGSRISVEDPSKFVKLYPSSLYVNEDHRSLVVATGSVATYLTIVASYEYRRGNITGEALKELIPHIDNVDWDKSMMPAEAVFGKYFNRCEKRCVTHYVDVLLFWEDVLATKDRITERLNDRVTLN